MDLSKVLSQLRDELEHLDAAILSLERLQQEGRRRGRPLKSVTDPNKARAAGKNAFDPDAPSGQDA